MGKPQAAAKAFEAVAADTAAPAALRAEALVRLGLVRRDLRRRQGSRPGVRARVDRARTRQGLPATAGPGRLRERFPDEERWNEIWEQVVVKVDRTDAEQPIVRVEWPGVPAEPRHVHGQPITPGLQGRRPAGRLPHRSRTCSQLNIVVHPGDRRQGHDECPRHAVGPGSRPRARHPTATRPSHVGNLVEIGPPDRLGTRRHFEGKPIDIDFKSVDLLESLQRIAENGGRTVSAAPEISGKVTLVLKQVPWDQAFDVLVRLNGLTWTMEGTHHPGRTSCRAQPALSRRARDAVTSAAAETRNRGGSCRWTCGRRRAARSRAQ